MQFLFSVEYSSLVHRLLVGGEKKSLVSTVHACAQLSLAEHVFRQWWEGNA